MAEVPEPGSKAYDKRRARLRKEAEKQGTPGGRPANEEAKERLEEEEQWGPEGPRTGRGRGPKGERGE